MPRKKITSTDKARQALLKGIQRSVKASAKAHAKRQRQIAAAKQADTVAKWRALRKAGVIVTKNAPAKNKLTPSIARKVNKAFRNIQRINHYDRGHVINPLRKESYKTKSGKKRTRYVFSDFFKPVKSKKKIKEAPGVMPTPKGAIVTRPRGAKVVVRNGEVFTKQHGFTWRQKTYQGDQILDLYRMIKEGEIKLSPNNVIVYDPFGWGTSNTAVDNNRMFIQMIDEYAQNMSSSTFRGFLDKTPFKFGTWPTEPGDIVGDED